MCPTMCVEGFYADGRMVGAEHAGTESPAYNTQIANISGHPALSVPAGRSPNGVPFGIQITGPRFADDVVLAVGAAWEAANPWPLAAPGFEPFGPFTIGGAAVEPVDLTTLGDDVRRGPLFERQRALGATFFEDYGRLWTASFGDPEAEYRQARERGQ